MLEKIRDTIKNSPLNDNLLANVLNKMNSDTRFTSYRFRSSTNAEDLNGFNGAGLYSSYSGKLNNVKILIDAEESWIQDAVDDLILKLMQTYNSDTLTVYSTLQTYRWDRLDYLKKIHARAKAFGFKLGFKIVRGAYMEKERERALKMGYPSPIHLTTRARNYERVKSNFEPLRSVDFVLNFWGGVVNR